MFFRCDSKLVSLWDFQQSHLCNRRLGQGVKPFVKPIDITRKRFFLEVRSGGNVRILSPRPNHLKPSFTFLSTEIILVLIYTRESWVLSCHPECMWGILYDISILSDLCLRSRWQSAVNNISILQELITHELVIYWILMMCFHNDCMVIVRDDTTKLMTHAYILRLKWFQWIKM